MPKEQIEIRALVTSAHEEQLVISMKLFNPGQRTLYAYQEPEWILYDTVTRKLTLHLHDQDGESDNLDADDLSEPSLVPLEGKTETTVEIALPNIMARLKPAAERSVNGPIVELIRISEAKELEIEIGYNDTPFYENPNTDFGQQLKEWGRTVAKANVKLKSSAKVAGKRRNRLD